MLGCVEVSDFKTQKGSARRQRQEPNLRVWAAQNAPGSLGHLLLEDGFSRGAGRLPGNYHTWSRSVPTALTKQGEQSENGYLAQQPLEAGTVSVQP